jgi:hypothetical protein
LAKPWTPVEKRDTTPEAAAHHREWWLGLTPVERLTWWLRRAHSTDTLRLNLIRQRNPGASEAELIALWTEETYRHSLDPAFLAKALAAIRARGTGL